MDNEFQEFSSTPTLTFGEPMAVQEAPAPAAQAAPVEESQLSPEELKQVEDFSKQIDIANTQAIMNYGVGTQKKMADFSEKAIDNVRTKDMGEVGNMIASLVTELKNFDVEEEEKGLKKLFKKSGNRITEQKARYCKVETNVQTIASELERHQATLLKDVAVLD
ncbi:MAG: toxic anion resistance protein, partial [Butyrivibrio sp.]|nr:toxic anion resistance protein [Butyrivibrio sp.]